MCQVLSGQVVFASPIVPGNAEGDDDFDELLLGLPFVNVSYRWQ